MGSKTKWLFVGFAILILLTVMSMNWWVYANLVGKNVDYQQSKKIVGWYSGVLLIFVVSFPIVIFFRPFKDFIAKSKTSIVMYILTFIILFIADIIGWITYSKLNVKQGEVPIQEDLKLVKTLTLSSASIITGIFVLLFIFIIWRKVYERKERKKELAYQSNSVSQYMIEMEDKKKK